MRVALIVTGIASAFAIASSAAAQGGPAATLCPATSGPGHARLSQVTLYSGRIEDNASLAPDSSTTVRGVTTNTWPLAGEGAVTVICLYGPDEAAISVRPPAGAQTCTERLRSIRAQPRYRPIDIVCR